MSEDRKRFPVAYTKGFERRLEDDFDYDHRRVLVVLDFLSYWDSSNPEAPVEVTLQDLVAQDHNKGTVLKTLEQLLKDGLIEVKTGAGRTSSSYLITEKFFGVIGGDTPPAVERKPRPRQQGLAPHVTVPTSVLMPVVQQAKVRVPNWKDDLDKLLARYPYSVWGDSRETQEEAYLAKIEEGFTFEDLWNSVDNYHLDRDVLVTLEGKMQTAEVSKTFSNFLNDDTWRSFRGVSKAPTPEEIAAAPAVAERYAKKKAPCISSPDRIDYSRVDFQSTVEDVEDDQKDPE